MRYISQDPAKYQEGTKMTMDFSILSLWLADSTPEAGNSNQDHPVWWPWCAPVAW